MEEALVRILTPKRSIDILRDVREAQEEKRPYVIVFVGVNGVGKSTNLAKVCRAVGWLVGWVVGWWEVCVEHWEEIKWTNTPLTLLEMM